MWFFIFEGRRVGRRQENEEARGCCLGCLAALAILFALCSGFLWFLPTLSKL